MKQLKGSSLIESMVAAAIFATVFAASLHTITSLALSADDSQLLLVEAEHRSAECTRKYGSSTYPPGEYTEEFEWGLIDIRITPYACYEKLHRVTLTTRIPRLRRQTTYDLIIPAHEPPARH